MGTRIAAGSAVTTTMHPQWGRLGHSIFDARLFWNKRVVSFSSSSGRPQPQKQPQPQPCVSTRSRLPRQRRRQRRTNLVFGANTDVGKTVVTAGLCRAAAAASSSNSTDDDDVLPAVARVEYIKPLQCGGSDEAFLHRYANRSGSRHTNTPAGVTTACTTLFEWDTPASPHVASRLEHKPLSDEELLTLLHHQLDQISETETQGVTYIETAGGVLSPAGASPLNVRPHHASSSSDHTDDDTFTWGWSTQADLYQSLGLSVPFILVGDGRLGGISCTLSALDSLQSRGYDVHAICLIEHNNSSSSSNGSGMDYQNTRAIREYMMSQTRMQHAAGKNNHPLLSLLDEDTAERDVVSLPPLPPPEQSLEDWFASDIVTQRFHQLHMTLEEKWNKIQHSNNN
eukprot:scaffold15265_cov51-Attheya_sp.AAC.2